MTEAVSTEMEGDVTNDTFVVVDRPLDRKMIGSWIRFVRNGDGRKKA